MPLRKWPPRLLDWRTVIGEVLIIVLGVMLALGVDRWAGERRDQDTAMQYVARLRSDLDTDLLGYDETVAWSQAIDQSALYVLDVYRGRNPAPDESDPFLQHLYRASWAVMGNTTSATYEELVSTGNMALLPVEVRGAVTEYYALKTNYLENRRQIFEEKAIDGYWPVPSAVLGPDLAPDAWLAAQGGGAGAQFDEPVTLGLSTEDLEAILDRLRDIETLEADLADIRHQMAQRTVLFGERLPAAARELSQTLERHVVR